MSKNKYYTVLYITQSLYNVECFSQKKFAENLITYCFSTNGSNYCSINIHSNNIFNFEYGEDIKTIKEEFESIYNNALTDTDIYSVYIK